MQSPTSTSTRTKPRSSSFEEGHRAFWLLHTSASRKAILPTVMQRRTICCTIRTCYEGAECTQNTICTGPLANQHSKDLIPFMVEKFGKKVFFVGSNYVWPKESNKNAKIWLKQAGGELLGEEYIPLGSSEFGPVLNKIRDTKPGLHLLDRRRSVGYRLPQTVQAGRFQGWTRCRSRSLTTGEIETRAMGAEFDAGHFLSAPYFQDVGQSHEPQVRARASSRASTAKTARHTTTWKRRTFRLTSSSAGLEKAAAAVGVENVTPRAIRDHSGGIRIEDAVSPLKG